MKHEDLAKMHWRMGPGILYRQAFTNERRDLVRITKTADLQGEKFMVRMYDYHDVIREEQRRELADAVRLAEEWLP